MFEHLFKKSTSAGVLSFACDCAILLASSCGGWGVIKILDPIIRAIGSESAVIEVRDS
jgi:hypothetical protein